MAERAKPMAERPQPQGTDARPGSNGATVGDSKWAGAFAPPSVSLPKGGGAIRGIGEKFSTNPVTGTGSMSVPIATSPGRSGFGPQLSLSYDSGTGNGPFGMGWSLPIPTITRKTDKGLPLYQDREHEESDVFILSGAEDLVPVLIRHGDDGWTYDETERDGYRVKRYRPRVEGLFSRIECWTRRCDGETHWRSLSKENVLTVYGDGPDSRIADPDEPGRVFSWLTSRSYDDKGNAIVYEYVAENDAGVDLRRANERYRVRTANRYLKRIRYGNRRSRLLDPSLSSARRPHVDDPELGTAGWMFEVIFDYDEGHYEEEPPDEAGNVYVRASAQPSPNCAWPVRRDPFSSYRSGYEVRTYRLCRRVLCFHHFPDELGTETYLVRSTEFQYQEKPFGSFITRALQSGYRRRAEGRYLKRWLPPIDFTYTTSPLEDQDYDLYEVQEIDCSSLANLPGGIDGKAYRWIDLDGEGISGVLTEQGDSWFYKPNLGDGRFGTMETVSPRPSLAALANGREEFLDLAGDGNLDLVELAAPTPGFYERTVEAGWRGFRTFSSLPDLNWQDANLRLVDVTGDGIADVLITEGAALCWHPSYGTAGFGAGRRVPVPAYEEKGPRLLFSHGAQSIYLSDMSGDGLSDLVRIRNGEVCYWPNLGYGRFGPRVTMDNAPLFDSEDLFDQQSIRLADTDGSGTSDLLYLDRNGVRVFLNESGNAWSSERVLRHFPAIDNAGDVSVVDLLGHGTACLLWSSPLPGAAGRQLRYVDLMAGKKPHLLVHVDNHLGAETEITYATSTEFYLADKAAGRPWATRLPFPVHVVTQVDTYDRVSRNRFTIRYTYHHGYFDGPEREFRGFGMVEQLDTQELEALAASGVMDAADNLDAASNVPPALTRTWFHPGAYLLEGRVSRHFEHEYWREPQAEGPDRAWSDPLALDDVVLPGRLTPEEAREACRALKGSMLRQEVYALDGAEASSRPYAVSEHNYTIRALQPRDRNRHAVFFTHARESLSLHYERTLYDVDGARRADPRVTHDLVLQVDDYGNVLTSVSAAYGRRYPDASPHLTDADRDKQQLLLLTLSENAYTNAVHEPDAYRTPLPSEARTYEIVKLAPVADRPHTTNRFRFDEMAAAMRRASHGAHDLPYEDLEARGATGPGPYRRLIEESRSYYRADRLHRILPLGVLEALALPGQKYRLAFTPGLIDEIYRRDDPPKSLIPNVAQMLGEEGGYQDLDGNGHWWIPSGRVFYTEQETGAAEELEQAQRHFLQPRRFVDPFDTITAVAYDAHDLLPTRVRDAVGNTVQSEIDYRVLAPWRMTDANRNRTAVAFDALGLVAGTAVMGKQGEAAGDTLDGFEPDLDERVVLEHIAHPLRDPYGILRDATTRLVYDLFAFARTRDLTRLQPAAAYSMARETHVAALAPGERARVQHAFSYSDGFGREIQRKIQAEPGPVVDRGPAIDLRWVGSGWTIFNNKGKPVRQYEPFFTAAHAFEFAFKAGVSPILFYDPVERVVATLHPNHTYEKVVFDPWRQQRWDLNDTALEQDPAQDADAGDFFRLLPTADYLPTWYAQRRDGDLGGQEQEAALKTAVHAGTPNVAYADTLGRTFLTVDHNRFERAGEPIVEFLATRSDLDIEGNQLAVIDPLDRAVMRYAYGMLSMRLRSTSVDAGARWTLNDVLGKPLLTWDSRGNRLQRVYDLLRRPVDLRVRLYDRPEILAEHTIYGEGAPDDQARNLRAKIFRQFDAAGVVTNHRFDFKDNLLESSRRLLEDYEAQVDWSLSPDIEDRAFATATTYDALNRPVTLTVPDASIIRPTYNEANLLETLSVNLRGAAEATPFVIYLNYNARGQREIVRYGNGAHTRYSYDPLTFRLTHLVTYRRQDDARLQDLAYAYDPTGNITSIRDDAQETVYFRNHAVSASNDYVYDAIYRLISANGREHACEAGRPQTTWHDGPRMHRPLPADGHALHRYYEQYDYDAVGNILQLLHESAEGSWARSYAYDEPQTEPHNNRLTSTRVGDDRVHYAYDADGNMTRMPRLPRMEWDFKDQLHATQERVASADDSETTYYVYDGAGRRMRKVTERASGSRKQERVYLSGVEIYREFDSVGRTTLERETLHVMDGKRRVALVETKTIDRDEPPSSLPSTLLRHQFDNHVGSAVLELDQEAAIISYEEYYPYGSTSFQAGHHLREVKLKRYRYTGKERDEETGLYYHGARYYAPWLGRWSSADPAGLIDGPNLYQYSRGSPIVLVDRGGKQAAPAVDPETLVVAATALQRAAQAWGTAGVITGGAAAAAPAVAAAPIAAAAPAAAPAAVPAAGAATDALALGGAVVGAQVVAAFAMALAVQLHMQRAGSIARFGNPYGMPASDIAFPVLKAAQQLYTDPFPIPSPAPEPNPDEEKKQPKPGRVYVTYTKYNSATGLYYSGRTSAVIDLNLPWRPQAIAAVKARDANHHIDENDEPTDPNFGPAQIDQFTVGYAVDYKERYRDAGYLAIRGREQQLIDYYGAAKAAELKITKFVGGAQSDTKPGKPLTENVVRGVGKDNPLGEVFHAAANLAFGQLAPFTGTRLQQLIGASP
jgi:RHS repeat-associated protein